MITEEYRKRLIDIVDAYFDGDEDVKSASFEYASIKASVLMGGSSHASKLYKEFYAKYSDSVAYMGMEVVVMESNEY